jgi:hypothetical protein
MQIDQTIGRFFKPEVQSSGRKLVAQEKISISSGGDSAIQAYVRVMPPFKVTLATENIQSTAIMADCNCPSSKKGQLCKHIWATLVCVEEKFPDFLSAKLDIEKAAASVDPRSLERKEAASSAKVRSKERQKDYYQLQKARAKRQKSDRNKKETEVTEGVSFYPPEVESSLRFFCENGFPMPDGPSDEVIGEAKKILSRVFHPDRGGSHEESVQLNKHCDIIRGFLRVHGQG